MTSDALPTAFTHRAYAILANDDEGRICKDIPEAACDMQPGNFMRHVLSLSATKTADGLADAKLVLAWLLGALGAPTWLAGLLVPVREAGALLPQLAIAALIRHQAVRKWVWVVGSVVQGLAAIGMALAALWLDGASAGVTIVVLLGIAALARGACSVSYKDVLGKTVSKSARGTATGTAGSAAAVLVLAFGALLAFDLWPRTVPGIAVALALAGALWMVAAMLFAGLAEAPGATEGGGNALAVARQQWGVLRDDAQLRRFILTRALLVATALAPPYLLAAAGAASDTSAAGTLGPFVIASALAAILSAYVWGRLSDRSSRKVLILAALLAAITLAVAGWVALWRPDWLGGAALPAGLLFLIMVAHQGVRLGRATHLVDMADADQRATYTAVSNTFIGVVLLAGGVFGALAHWLGAAAVLLVFAAMALLAALSGRGLREVQADN